RGTVKKLFWSTLLMIRLPCWQSLYLRVSSGPSLEASGGDASACPATAADSSLDQHRGSACKILPTTRSRASRERLRASPSIAALPRGVAGSHPTSILRSSAAPTDVWLPSPPPRRPARTTCF